MCKNIFLLILTSVFLFQCGNHKPENKKLKPKHPKVATVNNQPAKSDSVNTLSSSVNPIDTIVRPDYRHPLFIRFFVRHISSKEDSMFSVSYSKNNQPRFIFQKDSVQVKFAFTGQKTLAWKGRVYENGSEIILNYDQENLLDNSLEINYIGTFVLKKDPAVLKINAIKIKRGY